MVRNIITLVVITVRYNEGLITGHEAINNLVDEGYDVVTALNYMNWLLIDSD